VNVYHRCVDAQKAIARAEGIDSHQQKVFSSRQDGSVGAVRDTLVGDYSAPGDNLMRRIPFRPLIAVSAVFLVLLVSYFKQSLWRHGQLRPYVGIG
jgi:hypothetical protein